MVICFCPSKLSVKPDSLMQRMDYYTKGGDRDYILVNPQNLCPIFTQEHFAMLLCTMHLQPVALDVAALVDLSVPLLDTAALVEDIKARLLVDPLAIWDIDLCCKGSPSPHFSISSSGLLLMDRQIYIPDYWPAQGNLHTHILQSEHDHVTAGHFGYNKTLELLRCDYVWPSIHTNCKNFVSQCELCT